MIFCSANESHVTNAKDKTSRRTRAQYTFVMLTARAFWTTGIGVGELREETLAPPGPGDVLVETLFTAISRGTESLVFRGGVPASENERMRAPHQAGSFPFPVKYGYLNVGRVVEGPSELRGRSVFCLYPHQSRYVVPAR